MRKNCLGTTHHTCEVDAHHPLRLILCHLLGGPYKTGEAALHTLRVLDIQLLHLHRHLLRFGCGQQHGDMQTQPCRGSSDYGNFLGRDIALWGRRGEEWSGKTSTRPHPVSCAKLRALTGALWIRRRYQTLRCMSRG